MFFMIGVFVSLIRPATSEKEAVDSSLGHVSVWLYTPYCDGIIAGIHFFLLSFFFLFLVVSLLKFFSSSGSDKTFAGHSPISLH